MIISRLFPLFAIASLAGAVLPRLDDHRRAQRRAHRVAVGRARADDAAAPRHVERQLDLPHVREAARDARRTTAPTSRRSAILSFGESWHNFHHAHPASARHGALPHQIDPPAAVIRLFERAGWATDVRWPTEAQLAICRSD